MSANTKINKERGFLEAKGLFTNQANTDIQITLPFTALETPVFISYTTRLHYETGLMVGSHARISLLDPYRKFMEDEKPVVSGLSSFMDEHEFALRDFFMEHKASTSKIHSGMKIATEKEDQGIGSFMVGLTNIVIEDMIIRFLTNKPDRLVYAFMSDEAQAITEGLNRTGWTSYQALKLGFQSTNRKYGFPGFMKRFPVKQILKDFEEK